MTWTHNERLMLRDLADSLLLVNVEHLRPKPEPANPAPNQPADPAITAMKARMARVRAAIHPPLTPDSAQEAQT